MTKAPKAVVAAFTALRHEFERCSRQYPPLYHELIVQINRGGTSPLPRPKFDKSEFCKALHEQFVKHIDDGWQEYAGRHLAGDLRQDFSLDGRELQYNLSAHA